MNNTKRPASSPTQPPTKRVFRLTTPAGTGPLAAQLNRMDAQLNAVASSPRRRNASSPRRRNASSPRRNASPNARTHYASANSNSFLKDLVSYMPFVAQAVNTNAENTDEFGATTRFSTIRARTIRLDSRRLSLTLESKHMTPTRSGTRLVSWAARPLLRMQWDRDMVLQEISVYVHEHDAIGWRLGLNQVRVYADFSTHPNRKPLFKPAVCEFFAHIVPAYLRRSPLRGPLVDVLLDPGIVASVCRDLGELPYRTRYSKVLVNAILGWPRMPV
jgi:hypothetical protein